MLNLNPLELIIFKYLLIFSRIGCFLMIVPGFSVSYYNVRSRLAFAIIFCILIYPLISEDYIKLEYLNYITVINETLTGMSIAIIIAILFSSYSVAGSLMTMQMGLSAATFFDPNESQQNPMLNNLLYLTLLNLIFATGIHEIFIKGIIYSYQKFPINGLVYADLTELIIKSVSNIFLIGFKLSLPILFFSLIFMVGNAILAKLMPSMNVFFVTTPLQILIGYWIIWLVFVEFMEYFIRNYAQLVTEIIG